MREPGQFFLAPSLFLLDKNPTEFLDVQYDEQTQRVSYHVIQGGPDLLERDHPPVKEWDLRSKEWVLLARCKLRPVVLVSPATDHWRDAKRRNDSCFLVAPIYSFKGDTEKVAFGSAFIERVKAFSYNTFFYLPASQRPHFEEGFVRFDRMQMVHQDWLRPIGLRLSPEALPCFQAWLSVYTNSEVAPSTCPGPGSLSCAPEWLALIAEYRSSRLKELGLA